MLGLDDLLSPTDFSQRFYTTPMCGKDIFAVRYLPWGNRSESVTVCGNALLLAGKDFLKKWLAKFLSQCFLYSERGGCVGK
jgi:hypothetical protein